METDRSRAQSMLDSSGIQPESAAIGFDLYQAGAVGHCENMIGTTQIPLGLAGPLRVKGQQAVGDFFVPLATTEGCLVASINRGCKAVSMAGGADVTARNIGITRAPVFARPKNFNLVDFKKSLNLVQPELQKIAQSVSQYLHLLAVEVLEDESYIWLRFNFDSGDAMGMNMVTIATKAMVTDFLEPQFGLLMIALSGNLCADKKPAVVNIEKGRGYSVNANVTLTTEVLQSVLKTNQSDFLAVYRAKIVSGSRMAGSLGQNAHIANVVSALFIATGQDPAHVVEASSGSTYAELIDGGVRVWIEIPSLVCGTVGGGTHLPTQHEALQWLRCEVTPETVGNSHHKFAEIIAATVLAGEISLLAALASQDLATAHAQSKKR